MHGLARAIAQLGHRRHRRLVQVDALGRGGEIEHDQPDPVAPRGGVLFQETLVGQRGEQAMGRRLGDVEVACQIADPPLAIGGRERLEDPGRVGDRAERRRACDAVVVHRVQRNQTFRWAGRLPSLRNTARTVTDMGVLRLSHVDISEPDLELAAAYYTQVLGLDLVERTNDAAGDRLFLKCWDERDHHSLAIRYDPRVGIDRYSFKVEFEHDLDDIEAQGRAATASRRAHQQGRGGRTGRVDPVRDAVGARDGARPRRRQGRWPDPAAQPVAGAAGPGRHRAAQDRPRAGPRRGGGRDGPLHADDDGLPPHRADPHA